MRLRIIALTSMGMRILRAARYPAVPAVCGYRRIPAVDQLLCHAWHVPAARAVIAILFAAGSSAEPVDWHHCANSRQCAHVSTIVAAACRATLCSLQVPSASPSLLCARKAANLLRPTRIILSFLLVRATR